MIRDMIHAYMIWIIEMMLELTIIIFKSRRRLRWSWSIDIQRHCRESEESDVISERIAKHWSETLSSWLNMGFPKMFHCHENY